MARYFKIVSFCLALTLLLGLLPRVALPSAVAEKTVIYRTLKSTASASENVGFYFTVSEADPLPYSSDWNTRPDFTEGGAYLSDGTLLASSAVKLSASLYYVSLRDYSHTAVDDEIIYVDGTVETEEVQVIFERTAFQFDAATDTWAVVATIEGAQLTLGDTLDMTFALCVPTVFASQNPTVELTLKGETATQALPAVADDGRYYVTASVSAKDMTAPITVCLKDGSTVLTEKTTSVRAFGESILNGNFYDVHKAAAKAMLNYGAAAQVYFGQKTDDLANENCAYTDEIGNINAAVLPATVIDGPADGYLGTSLLLKSATAVRLYFDHPIAGGLAVEDRWYLEFTDIGAADLDKTFTVTVEDTTYTFSVLSLARKVLVGSYGAAFTKLMQTVVLYSNACEKIATDLLILTPGETTPAVPYLPHVEEYLLADDPNVADYTNGSQNPNKPITVRWNGTSAATGYTVAVATKSDYSDAKIYKVGVDTDSVDLYNLFKATKYYVKVTADGTELVSESTFTTTDVGPRVMLVDGVYNVRDVGGYASSFGKTSLQGMLYRGGALNPSTIGFSYVNITEEGKRVMSEEMGIVSELDLRNPDESYNLQESLIPGADLYFNPSSAYESAVQYGYEPIKKSFQLLARPENYPVYFHCTGGADRTGTLSFLVGAVLGYSEKDLINDYEMTSFSTYGERNSRPGTTYTFADMYDYLLTFEGETLAEKVENYLLSIGVTADEIYNLRAIMFGEETRDLPAMELTPAEPSGEEEPIAVPTVFDYMNSEDTITLNAECTTFTSDLAVGYGNTVRIPLDTNTVGNNGRTDILIGSYGVRIRGGEFRVVSQVEEIARYTGMNINNKFFDNGGYLDMTVTLDGDNVNLTLDAHDIMGGRHQYTYSFARIANEIASDEAKITVKIDTSEVDEVILAP